MMLILRAILLSACFVGYNFSPLQSNDDGKPSFRYDYNYHPEAQGWFKLHKVPVTWFEARRRCKLEGAELVAPSTRSIVEVMNQEMQARASREIFTGLHSIFSQGDYYSISGMPLERMPIRWPPLGPESDTEKRCVVFFQMANIINVRCNEKYPYICYKKNENISLTECGTTDKDYTFVPELNTCYKYNAIKKTWRDSYMSCSAEGGHLVIINNFKELNYVQELINRDPETASVSNDRNYGVYIGVAQLERNEWSTIHGDDIEGKRLPKWAEGEPSEDNDTLCGGLTSDGFLKAMSCENKWKFICEKKPDSLKIDEEYLEIV